tara:strand:- start:67 stop:552 length:486 start_codon:yes stop_codon:yes gene_type:complete
MWKTSNKKMIEYDSIVNFLKEAVAYDHQIVLGTDSQPFNSGTFLVTALVVLCQDRAYHCRYFYKEHANRPTHYSLYDRIYSEVDTTLNIAHILRDEIPQANFTIHLDVNHDIKRGKTAKFSTGLVAMVKGYGYQNVEIKPNAWCASKVADRHTKNIPAYLH